MASGFGIFGNMRPSPRVRASVAWDQDCSVLSSLWLLVGYSKPRDVSTVVLAFVASR